MKTLAQPTWANCQRASVTGTMQLSRFRFGFVLAGAIVLAILVATFLKSAHASEVGDEKVVASLDTQYQAAVKQNDAGPMDRILADDFILVTGSGRTYSKADLLEEARSGRVSYEHQEDTEQKVRIWGDTGVVTAKLWEKGSEDGRLFDRTLWFSDTYVRTARGWRYVFGQASLPRPKSAQQQVTRIRSCSSE